MSQMSLKRFMLAVVALVAFSFAVLPVGWVAANSQSHTHEHDHDDHDHDHDDHDHDHDDHDHDHDDHDHDHDDHDHDDHDDHDHDDHDHDHGDHDHDDHDDHDHDDHDHGDHDHDHDHDHGDHDHDHGDHDHDHDDHDHDHDHGDHDHDHDHHHGGVQGTRLLVSDAEGLELYVVDLYHESVIGTFTTPGEGSRVYPSPSGQYAFAVDRDANRVSVIHSGLRLVDHGDHFDLLQENPYVLSTMNVGRQPTHFWTGERDIVIFNDQDGTIAVLDYRLLGLSLDFAEIVTERPDHGSAATLGDYVLSGHLHLDRVDVYTRDGAFVETFEGCPRLHGQASMHGASAFGCTDGVLLVKQDGEELTSVKLDNPAGSPEDARVGTLHAHHNSPVIIGNFGEGLAIIDPEAESMDTVDLPASPMSFAFDWDGERLIVLTADGALHALEPETGEVLASLELMEISLDDPRPGLAIAPEMIYVSNPTAGEIFEIEWHHGELELERTLSVPGTPGGIAVMALPEGVLH